jgi:hypothetical protein
LNPLFVFSGQATPEATDILELARRKIHKLLNRSTAFSSLYEPLIDFQNLSVELSVCMLVICLRDFTA